MNNRCLLKICKMCGKAETSHWSRHWDTWHGIKDAKDRILLNEGEEPQQPWCSNWWDVIDQNAVPIDILP